MKLAVNTLFLIPGEVGGSETYVRETLKAILDAHSDVEITLITNRENDALFRSLAECHAPCTTHRLPVRATNRYTRIVAEQVWLPLLVRRIRPDWLWSPGYTMPCYAPCRQVVSILDMQYRTHPEDLSRIARWTTEVLVRMAVKRADCIKTISEFSKNEIIRWTGCPSEKIHVTHLAADSLFDNAPDSGLMMDRNTPYILTVANSYPHKNLHRLVEAFRLIHDRIPHRLVLVGAPRRGEPQLVSALNGLPQDRFVRCSGLARADLAALYQAASVFVLPSLYEGFGLPVLEAMRAGTPVVAARKGAIPEIGGDCVRYVEGDDPEDIARGILEVLEWPEERRRVHVAAARAHAVSFNWSATAKGTLHGLT